MLSRAIFEPRSVVVVGGTNDPRKPGGRVTELLIRRGGPRLFVVNPRGGEVQGLPTFGAVEELPETPELAIMVVPTAHVLDAVRRLCARGTRAFVVLSNGFSEVGPAGRALEEEIVALLRAAGADLIGPNSLGVVTPAYCGAFGGPELEAQGGIADFVSASGSTAAFVMEAGVAQGLRFASFVSVGNSAMHGVESVLGAYAAQERLGAPVKLLYLESITDAAALARHAVTLRRRGAHVVALKAGTTEIGQRAASSHTGALASRDQAVSALLRKAGVCRVHSRTQMVNVAGLLGGAGAPAGRNVAVVTHAGGPAIILCDELSRRGFRVPEFAPRTQERLAAALFPGSATANPVDFLAAGTAAQLRAIFDILHEEERSLDAICVVFGSPGLFDIGPVLDEIAAGGERLPIPIYPVLPSVQMAAAEHARFRAAGHFYFTDERLLAEALDAVARTPVPAEPAEPLPLPDPDAIAAALGAAQARGGGALEPAEVVELLRGAGLPAPPAAEARDADEAVALAERFGFPVVLKVLGPLHKTDVGGVALDLRDAAAVRAAHARLAALPTVRGVLVQKHAVGLELLCGLSREDGFGHLVLFGLGGVFAEAIGDVAGALAPLSPDEARGLLRGIAAQRLLGGWRGLPAVDEEALVGVLRTLSALAERFPQIRELDLNPLLARGSELCAVDARVIVASAPQAS